jgi:hypothetical protein
MVNYLQNGKIEMYLLESASSGTRSKPLPNILAELLSDEGHPMDTKGAERRGVVKEPREDSDIGSVVFDLGSLRDRYG